MKSVPDTTVSPTSVFAMYDDFNCLENEMFFAICPNDRCCGGEGVKMKVVEDSNHTWKKVLMSSRDDYASLHVQCCVLETAEFSRNARADARHKSEKAGHGGSTA